MQKERINAFLVDAFNTILQLEERALANNQAYSNLSVKEYHVIEAVIAAGEHATMSTVSKRLSITVGSLTVAVKTLENKGYLRREKRPGDKRMVYVIPTERGLQANAYHAAFHRSMVEAIVEQLPPKELDTLVDALGSITSFFDRNRRNME